MAVEGVHFEKKLHKELKTSRACYFWKEKNRRSTPLTFKEIDKLAKNKLKACNEKYYNIYDVYTNHVQTTRLELFKVAPRKFSLHIVEIITNYIISFDK